MTDDLELLVAATLAAVADGDVAEEEPPAYAVRAPATARDRSRVLVGALVVLLVLVVGGSLLLMGRNEASDEKFVTEPPTTVADPDQVQRYDDGFLSFDHPARWAANDVGLAQSGVLSTLAYLSTMPLHEPCSTEETGQVCGTPLDALDPGAVFVWWYIDSVPSIPPPTYDRTVSGFPASLSTQRPGSCLGLQADETMTFVVDLPDKYSYVMEACLAGPDLAGAEAAVTKMVQSVSVANVDELLDTAGERYFSRSPDGAGDDAVGE
jgi:hypothetical protein